MIIPDFVFKTTILTSIYIPLRKSYTPLRYTLYSYSSFMARVFPLDLAA